MQAIVQDRYGPADVLRLEQRDKPTPGPGDVLVQVRAAGVDRGVWHLMTGLPYAIRAAGFGLTAPTQQVPGSDLAGIVEEVGAGVTEFAVGDEVFGIGRGTFATYAVAPEAKLAHKPARLSFEEAATLGISGLTALQALRDHAGVRPGQSVLIVGASGGVGSYAVQIAAAFGARVTGVASAGKVDLVAALGAERVVDYTTTDFADEGIRYDAIIDVGGNASLTRLRRALAPRGTLVITGGEGGGRWLGGTDRQLRALLLSRFSRQRLTTFVNNENAADLRVLGELVDAGSITPLVERTFSLAEAADAIRHVETGRSRGKTAIAL